MNIAIIGTGNVGGALATRWAEKGHRIFLGVRNSNEFKGMHLLSNSNTTAHSIHDAVAQAEVVLIATPAPLAVEVAKSLGDSTGKVIIDSMNIVLGRGPQGYTTTAEAILDHTGSRDVVKCFNTTGFNNMLNPTYGDQVLDMFVAGDSEKGKSIAVQLALDAGFAACYSVGGNDRFALMEQFAFFWINLAMMQGQGRDIGFKLLKR
ncbi:MAG TPA: NAD(P)-binding domain-containing protein [Flavobacteriales bacterium]|nr:NADPH-dependent F420 reductase [Flavobacteriales bacterium]HRE73976.1 NAD(P)-binding domain-containing protein [Flavobacteriales bacterium]HRE96638.1 NAD(P)-binding domain-containing protein [Flavobacteriales bacterium]HRJ35483.1 NAD(P)-binding domain-containing protein [Flavobacteriales bacterium]HRJ39537.1 NAD(P)-binding domain-containing protein [Flavobacteriales bacterium]